MKGWDEKGIHRYLLSSALRENQILLFSCIAKGNTLNIHMHGDVSETKKKTPKNERQYSQI